MPPVLPHSSSPCPHPSCTVPLPLLSFSLPTLSSPPSSLFSLPSSLLHVSLPPSPLLEMCPDTLSLKTVVENSYSSICKRSEEPSTDQMHQITNSNAAGFADLARQRLCFRPSHTNHSICETALRPRVITLGWSGLLTTLWLASGCVCF